MKQKAIELILLSLLFCALSFTANANYDTELAVSLHEAMMESNADYNKHKKTSIRQEFGRIDDWSDRDDGSITINEKNSSSATQSKEYKEEIETQEDLQEVSLNDNE